MRRGTSTDVTGAKPRVDVPDVRVVVWFGIVFCLCGDFYDSAKVFGLLNYLAVRLSSYFITNYQVISYCNGPFKVPEISSSTFR